MSSMMFLTSGKDGMIEQEDLKGNVLFEFSMREI